MGKFIVIAGTDGSGKATQTEILANYLRESGYKVRVFDFPRYGQKSAQFVEMYLRGEFGSAKSVSPYVASLFYAIDRHFAAEDIAKAVESEDFVLTNRYITANMGHQGGKIKDVEERNKYLDWLEELEHEKLELPRPNQVIFLYLPPVQNLELNKKKGFREYLGDAKDIHEEDQNHMVEASEAYKQIADDKGWTRIDCLRDGELMTREEIAQIIRGKLGLAKKSEC
jgi:dTMP kinase